MSKINDGGPAYPGGLFEPAYGGSNDRKPYNDGMSLRDWFAGQALAGMCAHRGFVDAMADAAIANRTRQSYEYADAMLAARCAAPAAPAEATNAELLEALEKIIDLAEPNPDYYGYPNEAEVEEIKSARATIAKAKGGDHG
jgi:hypothetical protein